MPMQKTKKPQKQSKITTKPTTNNKQPESKEENKESIETDLLLDEDPNSGFANYLRSNEGLANMKLFVISNTLAIIFTMSWPNIKDNIYFLRDCVADLFNYYLV